MYRKILQPLRIFSILASDDGPNSAPRDVRVFEGDRLLYASYDHGREQILHVDSHDRTSLISFFVEAILPTAEPAE